MIRFHPILFPVFFTLIFTGNISLYALLLISLIVHELGHLCAAKLMGGRVLRCTIMPYGGEIILARSFELKPHQWLVIMLGGPFFTLCLLSISLFLPDLIKQPMLQLQIILLTINLLPFYPLDGGRVIMLLMEIWFNLKDAKKIVYQWSVFSYAMIGASVIFLVPQAYLITLFCTFLIVQNVSAYRYLKYEIALHKQLKRNK